MKRKLKFDTMKAYNGEAFNTMSFLIPAQAYSS